MSKRNPTFSADTVAVGKGQFQLSPFFEKYQTEGMIMGGYAGRFFSFNWGGDPVEAYKKLRTASVLYDVPERPLEISGPDALALLEKVLSRPIGSLKIGKARYAIACLEDGGILMDGIVMRLDEERYWYVKADGEFDTWLKAHAIGMDVEITDPNSWVLQIQGPTSLEVMRAATAGALDETLGYFNLAWFDIGGQRLLVSRTGWTGEFGYEIYTQGDDTDAHALWDHLLSSGEPHGLIVSSVESMSMRRIEAGILNNRTDMDETMTPYAAGLGAFVDLQKPDFIGRDALTAADRSCRFFGIKTSAVEALDNAAKLFLSGLDVFLDEHRVGEVTASAYSPTLKCMVGYVRLDEAGDWPGTSVEIRNGNDVICGAEICDLPFYDSEKRIPRGLDHTIPEF